MQLMDAQVDAINGCTIDAAVWKAELQAAAAVFVGDLCTKNPQNQQNVAVQRNGFHIGDTLENVGTVGKLCYLGDMLNADGGARHGRWLQG